MRLSRTEWRSFLKALRGQHGPVKRLFTSDSLDTLIQTILSQSTTDALSGGAFDALKTAYPSWEEAKTAGPSNIQRRIRRAGLSKRKAERIHGILTELEARFGQPSLEALDRMSRKQAWEFLLSFEGVGPKTAACVLLFARGRSAFPIDTHVSRVCHRLGLLSRQTATIEDHERLRLLIPREQHYRVHILMVRHGRLLCRPARPACDDCDVLPWCGYPCPAARKLLTART